MSFINKVRHAFTKNRPANAKVGSLETSLDIKLSLYYIKNHQYQVKEIVNWSVMATVWLYVLIRNPVSFFKACCGFFVCTGMSGSANRPVCLQCHADLYMVSIVLHKFHI